MTMGTQAKGPKEGAMEPRIDYAKAVPEVGAAMVGLEEVRAIGRARIEFGDWSDEPTPR